MPEAASQGLGHLQALLGLRSLKLTQAQHITDEGIRYITALPRLEYLNITYTNITDQGLAFLLDSSSLRRVAHGWAAKSRRWQKNFEAAHPDRSFVIE